MITIAFSQAAPTTIRILRCYLLRPIERYIYTYTLHTHGIRVNELIDPSTNCTSIRGVLTFLLQRAIKFSCADDDDDDGAIVVKRASIIGIIFLKVSILIVLKSILLLSFLFLYCGNFMLAEQ